MDAKCEGFQSCFYVLLGRRDLNLHIALAKIYCQGNEVFSKEKRTLGMIHHLSIEADNPMKVATVLAKLMGGRAREGFPFKDACGAFSGDEYGTMIECWPRGKVATIPKSGPGKFETSDSEILQNHQAFHTAISVQLDDDEIMEIARDAGWQTAVRGGNAPFSLVEVWIENRLLLEVLSPTQTENYLRVMT